MVVIRCTQKLLRRMGPVVPSTVKSTAKLGDWSANLLGVGHRRFVLLVSEPTRLPILIRASETRSFPKNFPDVLALVLEGLRISPEAIRKEISETHEARVCPTNNRSVLASLNDFSRLIKWHLYENPNADPTELSVLLSGTPIIVPFGGDSPQELTRRLLV